MATSNTNRRNSIEDGNRNVRHTQVVANESTERTGQGTKQIDKDTENSRNESMLDIDAEFLEVLISSHSISSMQGIELSQKISRKMKAVEMRMDRLFRNINNSGNTNFNNIVALAQAYLYMSYIYSKNESKKERLYIRENHLLRSLELLQDGILDRKAILIVLRVLHEFACIYNTFEDPQRTHLFLHKAYQIYSAYTSKKDYPTPINIINVVNIEGIEQSRFYLNNLFEVTLNALIHLHSSKPGYINRCKAMMYTHEMLKNKLNQIIIFEYKDYIDWIISSAKLSECLAVCGRFTEAREHLAAASLILQKLSFGMRTEKRDQDESLDQCDLQYEYFLLNGQAIISRYWAKYGIELLRSSNDELLRIRGDDKHRETSTLKSGSSTDFREQYTELTFPNLKEDLEVYIGLITDKYVVTYDETTEVSTKILGWLAKAKLFNSADKHLEEYVRIEQDVSKVYKYLAYFEKNHDKQKELHNCRVKILEEVVNLLNPKDHAEIYKQIHMELGIAYSATLNAFIESISTIPGNGIIDKADDSIYAMMSKIVNNFSLF